MSVINTLLTSTQALSLIEAEYSFGTAHHCRFIERGFNDTYLVGIDADWYILRVYLNNKYYIDSSDDFRFELDLLLHLQVQGLPVSVARQTSDGEYLGTTETPAGKRYFALFTYAPGDPLRKQTVTKDRLHQFGKTMAEMHLAANSFASQYGRYQLDRKYLVDEPLRIIAQQQDAASRTVSEEELQRIEKRVSSLEPIEELIEALSVLDTGKDEFGIIHSDLHLGNVHFDDNGLTIFDFDHCAYGWRAYELCLVEFLPDEFSESLLRGYESVRPLSEAERHCIPVFAKLRELWDIGDSLAVKAIRHESRD